jgi:hypothetical protein
VIYFGTSIDSKIIHPTRQFRIPTQGNPMALWIKISLSADRFPPPMEEHHSSLMQVTAQPIA